MQSLKLRALVAFVTVILVLAVSAAAQAKPRHNRSHSRKRAGLELPADYAQWSRVATCEEGGWVVRGYGYPDSIGINRTNFLAFGGRPLPPGPVSRANRIMEIRVADRLIAHYRAAIPDRYGCAAW